MTTFLSKDILAGLKAAQKTDSKKKNRFRIEFNKKNYPVIRLTKSGFCVEAKKAPMISVQGNYVFESYQLSNNFYFLQNKLLIVLVNLVTLNYNQTSILIPTMQKTLQDAISI